MEIDSNKIEISSIYKNILDTLKSGVNIIDENGTLLYVNDISAEYSYSTPAEMIGQHISSFYPQAALLDVLVTKQAQTGKKITHTNGKRYLVDAYPLTFNGNLKGGYAVFTDITEIEGLQEKVEKLEMQLTLNRIDSAFELIIGKELSLNKVISRAQKAIGALAGPRHCMITGQSGTGKTFLAQAMYDYSKKIGVIKNNAPFIEINCARFTNPDIAAMEVFGSEKGAYTGSIEKRGLFELANGGMLFLDEAHALEHHQTILLKAIESGKIRRIGGVNEFKVNVIIIAASTQDLKKVFLPELYQRLAQYELKLPTLSDRTLNEKKQLLEYFTKKYEESAYSRYGIRLDVKYSKSAMEMLLNYNYPRNIREFRDVINLSIDSSVPLVNDIENVTQLNTVVDEEHIPIDIFEKSEDNKEEFEYKIYNNGKTQQVISLDRINEAILALKEKGLGPRRIAKILNERGVNIQYYQVAYRMKNI